ncbi:MAG: hypothetical protein KME42_21870 [Tildeniella nuda ZEHNDER 1965/U140]|jgi:shikimate kinase|nr:hypothetical protein [Tildeniella nuda ZEHNDER 1965/U140]
MHPSIPFHDLVEYVDALPADDQALLFELIQKRRIEKQRLEIAQNAAQLQADFKAGVAKCGSFDDLRADLLRDN